LESTPGRGARRGLPPKAAGWGRPVAQGGQGKGSAYIYALLERKYTLTPYRLCPIEFKSQVGPSFGNNFNNRTEEALGNATDLWAAYREGAFKPSQRPWLGYFMLLEEAPGSTSPVAGSQPHFQVFPEFRGATYAKRYEILLTKLMRERLYDAACFLMTTKTDGLRGEYKEPNAELSFANFIQALLAKAMAIAAMKEKTMPMTAPVIGYVEELPPGEPGPGEAAPPPLDED